MSSRSGSPDARRGGAQAVIALASALVFLAACTEPNARYRPAAVADAASTGTEDAAPADTAAIPVADGAADAPRDAAAAEADAAPGGPDSSTIDAPGDETGAEAGCGTGTADVSAISGARGIAVGTDGTIYFTREDGGGSWIGRLAPGGALEASWMPMAVGAQLRTLRFDHANQLLYVAASGTDALYGVDLTFGRVFLSVSGLASPHGLALEEDGALLLTLGDGYVWRLRRTPERVSRAPLTTSPIDTTGSGERPLGVTTGGPGQVFVGTSLGRILRYRVQDDLLVEPTLYQTVGGEIEDLAMDVAGRLYVAGHAGTAPRQLIQIAAAGGAAFLDPAVGLLAGLAFGRGALDCQDLYVGDLEGVTRRYRAPDRGANGP